MREIPIETIKNKFNDLNPHWTTNKIDSEIRQYGKRAYFELFFPLVTGSNVRRAVVLMGPRRVGKTVILFQVIQELINRNTNPKSIVYLPLDTPLLQSRSLEDLVKLFAEIHNFKNLSGCTVIFDEIQYLNDWSNHLKVLVDQYKGVQFIASGSAAAALRLKSRESGAGRFTDFTLPPLTFYEFLDLQGFVDKYFHSLKEFEDPIPLDISSLNAAFIDYINYGGYPEAVFNPEIQKNPSRFIRSDIIEKVLLRDLPSLYGINDIQDLTRLFYTLAFQTGNEVTFEGLSRSSGIAKNTIKKYIEYLEAAFLLKTVRRVDNSAKTFKKINYFKVHLTNPSMYSALFGLVKDTDSYLGSLVETTIFSQWMHAGELIGNIYYARWKRGKNEGEVDLVYLDAEFRPQWCTEIKWTDRYFHNPNKLHSLIHFGRQCDLESVLATTKTISGIKEVGGYTIRFSESAVLCFALGRNLIESNIFDLNKGLDIAEKDQLALFPN